MLLSSLSLANDEIHSAYTVCSCCRRPPYDVALERGELLESEYIVAAGAAIMVDAVPRATPPTRQAVAAVSKASQVYQRMATVPEPPGY
jgi:hypothetical protein